MMLPSLRAQMENTDPSWTFLATFLILFVPVTKKNVKSLNKHKNYTIEEQKYNVKTYSGNALVL
jgi:hypothetical protein